MKISPRFSKLRVENLEERTLLAVMAGGIEQASELVAPTEAATWIVNTWEDPTSWDSTDGILSLREAIARAEFGDRISFESYLAGDTIYLNGNQLEVSKGLTIDASDIGGITINANWSRVFYISDSPVNKPVKLIGLTITGGVSFESDCAAVYACDGYIEITDCTFSGNWGGIYNLSSNLTMTNCVVRNNYARDNKGVIHNGPYATGSLMMKNCIVTENDSTTYGDGNGIYNSSWMEMIDCTISCNTTNNGAIYNGGYWMTMTNCTISGNSTENGQCGGIYNTSDLTMTGCTVSGNVTINGACGGIYSNNASLTMIDCAIVGNTGGGIYFNETSNYPALILTNCTISGNSIGNSGYNGGIYINAYDNCPMSVTNCIITYNDGDDINVDYFSNSSNIIGSDPGFVTAPIFDETGKLINLEDIDLSLSVDSIAIDRGDNSVVTTETDIAGNLRVVTSWRLSPIVDIGAYEYQEMISPSTITVTTAEDIVDETDNLISLREAIQSANDGDRIIFSDRLSGQTITLNNYDYYDYYYELGYDYYEDGIYITKSITIDASSIGGITIDAGQRGRVFYIESPANVELSGLIVTGGSGSGIFNSGSLLTMTGCTVIGNIGSGIINNNGTLIMSDCIVSDNSAGSSGRYYGISSIGNLVMTNCTISGNNGNGIYIYDDRDHNNNTQMIMTNCTISGNLGDGIYISNSSDIITQMTIINSVIVGNHGWGIYCNSSTDYTYLFHYPTMTMTNCTITGNTYGVRLEIYELNLKNCIICCNWDSDFYDYSYYSVENNNIIGPPDLIFDPGFKTAPVFDESGKLINFDSLDLSPSADSIAIDSGDNIVVTTELDIAGNPRIFNDIIDIGAYEYQDAPTSSTIIVTTARDTVNEIDNLISLREAIQNANSGDIIIFDSKLAGQTITLNGSELSITKDVTIDASSIGGITIDANEQNRVFYIELHQKHVNFSNITISGGNSYHLSGGGIYNLGGIVTMTDCSVLGNTASPGSMSNSPVGGGGIYNQGRLTMVNCYVSDNITNGLGSGGGILNVGTLTMTGCTVLGNSQDDYSFGGGGIFNCGSLTMTNCTITENMTNGDGGGGILVENGALTMTNCIISENTANGPGRGGGVCLLGLGGFSSSFPLMSGRLKVVMNNCTILKNAANGDEGFGSGIFLLTDRYSNLEPSSLCNLIVVQNKATSVNDDIYVYTESSNLSIMNSLLGSYTDDYRHFFDCFTYDSTLPLFSDESNEDYSLTEGSQAIDRGKNGAITTETDLAGNLRVYNGIVDLGAYEYHPELPTFSVSVTDWSGSYDSSAHSITVNDPYAETDTIRYSVDGITYDLTQNPQYTDVGTYTTYVKVSRSGYQDWYGSAVVEITPAMIDDITLTGWSGHHDGLAHSITVNDPYASTDTIHYSTDGITYNLTNNPQYTNAGTYTTYVRVSRTGCQDWYGSAVVKIGVSVVTTLDDVVDGTDGLISLREAVTLYAVEGDTITFEPELVGGTIVLGGSGIVIGKGITIDASGIDELTIDAAGLSRAFYVSGGNSENPVELINLTITGGNAANNHGGGIYNTNSGTLILTNCTIYGNTANDEGGGICNDGMLTLTNSAVFGNTANSGGGGICNDGMLTLTNSAVFGNTANSGGGFYNYYGELTIMNCTVTGNTANSGGGGMCNYGGTLTLTNSSVSGNTANSGGGIDIEYGTLTMTNCTVSENSSNSFGGGFRNYSGKLTMTNCTVSGSSANNRGGGLYNYFCALTMSNCTVSGNIVSRNGHGGGFYNYNGELTITNCTVTGNTANNSGGGFCNYEATVYIYNTAIAQNTAGSSGNDVYHSSGSLYGYNTLSSFTDWTESENCIVYDHSIPLFTDALHGDYTLAENSQAIDKGNNSYVTIDTDLAGNARIVNGIVDIGAYERQLETSSTIVTTLEDVVDETDGQISLREAVNYAAEGDTVTFALELAGGTIALAGNEIVIDKGITIDSSEIGGITIDANRKSGNFLISCESSDHKVELIDLRIINSYGNGIVIEDGTITITKCTITNNYANGEGGGIWNLSGIVTFVGCTISGNFSSFDGRGGGICNDVGEITMIDCIVFANSAEVCGGGIYNNSGSLTMIDCDIEENTSTDDASLGGGIYNCSGTLTMIHCTISRNTVRTYGGGVYNDRGILILTDCIVDGNTAESDTYGNGGGIYNSFGSSTLINCSVLRNYAKGSDQSFNICSGYGGGIWNDGNLTLTNCTVSGNYATVHGGGICDYSARLTMTNSIVTSNYSGEDNDIYEYYGSCIDGNNIIGTDPGFVVAPIFDEEGNLANFDSLDLTLSTWSRAINAGNNDYVTVETDLAGNIRIIDGIVDIGAYEYQKIHLDNPSILTGNRGVYVSYGANRHQIIWTAVEHASGYELAYTANRSTWTTVSTAETAAVVAGLAYGQDIKYRVRALGTDSYVDSDWSEIKTFNVCPMDIDGDDFIGPGDNAILSAAWFLTEEDASWKEWYDIDGDGFIGPGDYSYLSSNWFLEAGDANLDYPTPIAADIVFTEYQSADLNTDLSVF